MKISEQSVAFTLPVFCILMFKRYEISRCLIWSSHVMKDKCKEVF